MFYPVSERFSNRYKRPFLFEGQEKLFRWVAKMEGQDTIHGLRNNADISEVWVENQLLMTCICHHYNILYIPIFQAWAFRTGTVSEQLAEYLAYQVLSRDSDAAYIEMYANCLKSESFSNNVKKIMARHDCFYDFENIFKGITDTDIYSDTMHVYEQGNEIIAANVLRILSERGCIKEAML
jgi:hypothetical protein